MSILDHFGKPLPKPSDGRARNILQASADAGLNIPELSGHFRDANALGPNTALTKDVRQRIRNKARMERTQNSYLTGILLTMSNYIVGTGPKLQMQITGKDGSPDTELNADIEKEFSKWSKYVGLAEKLRTATAAKKLDGEAFISVVRNPKTRESTGYGLSLQAFEADQVQIESMYTNGGSNDGGDGITYSKYGDPIKYPVLRKHPGENSGYDGAGSIIQWIPAEYMSHLYRIDRPGQKRGVSEILTALPLFAMLRRCTLATISNMEKSANITAVLETQAETDEFGNPLSAITDDDWMASLPTSRNTLLTLPNGMSMKEFQSGAPTSNYEQFQSSVLREIARCMSIPLNVASGDSSNMNYSSGRLDYQAFDSACDVERSYLEAGCLDKIFAHWLVLYYAADLGADLAYTDAYNMSHTWMWNRGGDVDQAKATLAVDRELRYGGVTRGEVLAKRGIDVNDHDVKAAEELGYESVLEYRQAIARYLHGEEAAEVEVEEVKESRPNRKPENDIND